MYRYVAYYGYRCKPGMNADDVASVNEVFKTDSNLNPMINKVFHDCVGKRMWKNVPERLDKIVKGWNWFLKDTKKGYVEILATEPLTDKELSIMEDETYGQICDGYNENPFNFKLANGHRYSIIFDEWPDGSFKEE